MLFPSKVSSLGALKKKKLSNKKKGRLLRQYNHPVYVRFQHNNLFFSTAQPTLQNDYHATVGLLADYKKKKKKKKTYMAGFEMGFLLQRRFVEQKIRTLKLTIKGQGAHFKGLYQGLSRHKKLRVTTFQQVTPLAHNGTKATRRRRL